VQNDIEISGGRTEKLKGRKSLALVKSDTESIKPLPESQEQSRKHLRKTKRSKRRKEEARIKKRQVRATLGGE